MFVASGNTDQVLRYDGVTGTFVGVFASGDGLSRPIGIEFSPHNGSLLVASGTRQQGLWLGAAFFTLLAASIGCTLAQTATGSTPRLSQRRPTLAQP